MKKREIGQRPELDAVSTSGFTKRREPSERDAHQVDEGECVRMIREISGAYFLLAARLICVLVLGSAGQQTDLRAVYQVKK